MELQQIKMIQSGNILEFYHYEHGVYTGDKKEKTGGRTKCADTKEQIDKNRKKTMNKNRNYIRRLALSNFTNKDKFVTLTYRENMQDIEKANQDFRKFIKNMKYRYGDFKYIAVIEFQERGAIHYHVLLNIREKIDFSYFDDYWDHGNVDVKSLTKHKSKYNEGNPVDNVGAYLVKYMLKENDDRLLGKKSYFTSRNLTKPSERYITNQELEEILNYYNLDINKKKYSNSYESEYCGKIQYIEFNLFKK